MTLHVKAETGTPTFVAGYEATPWAAGGWTINVPTGVQEGDLGFIITGRDDGAAITATDPAGWTRVIPDTPATNSNWRILTRVREAGDTGTIAFGGAISGTVVAFWYRNARLGSVGTRWIRSGTVATVTCPSLTRSVAGSVLLAIAGDRSVAATAGEQGYTSVTGATYARRYEGNPTLSAAIQICATFYAEIAPAGPPSDVVWTLNDSSTNAFGMQLELIPVGEWRKVSQPYLKLTNAWRAASAVFTKVNGQWREVWPGAVAAPKIGVPSASRQNQIVAPPGSGIYSWAMPYYPNVPAWFVTGDKTRIASCYVSIRWTPEAPKSPVEHTVTWEAPVGWGIYLVFWHDGSGGTDYYYAAMTDAEAASIVAPNYIVEIWTPRNGGYFAYMPVCWDVSGVTVPMRDAAAGGLDPFSGYAPFPPGVTATSALADYTVSNGYSDMGGSNDYTAVTITLKNADGGTLDTWTGALPYALPTHVPGIGIGPLTLQGLRSATARAVPAEKVLYWPEEWRGLFDSVSELPQHIAVEYAGDTVKGSAEWHVFMLPDMRKPIDPTKPLPERTKIGDFRLAMHRDFPNVIEIHAVNLRDDLIGKNIMRTIVAHGVLYCPTKYVIVKIPDSITYEAMRTWGWQTWDEGSEALYEALWIHAEDDVDKYLGIVSDPMFNRFFMLGMPSAEEVAR